VETRGHDKLQVVPHHFVGLPDRYPRLKGKQVLPVDPLRLGQNLPPVVLEHVWCRD
jgi:hypothetical protein